VEGFDDPPDCFHVVGFHGFVVVIEVDPATEAGDGGAPFGDVAQDGGSAGFVELRDAVALDVGFGVEAEFLFDEVFHGEAVAVPAEASLDFFALHGVVAGDDVLDGVWHEMPEVGQAGGKGGAVVEDVFRRMLCMRRGFPLGNGLCEDVVVFPEFEDFLLHLGETDFGVYWFVHSLLLLQLCHITPTLANGVGGTERRKKRLTQRRGDAEGRREEEEEEVHTEARGRKGHGGWEEGGREKRLTRRHGGTEGTEVRREGEREKVWLDRGVLL